MNKNNKRKSALAAMALTLIVGAGSMAYFTDQKYGGVTATAANVSLGSMEENINITDKFVPGDNISFADYVNSVKYTGNVKAKYRILVGEDAANVGNEELGYSEGAFAYNTNIDEPGYHFIKDGKPVELPDEGVSGAPMYVIGHGLVNPEEEIIFGGEGGYKLHINEATPNKYQDTKLTLPIRIDVIQDDHVVEKEGVDGIWVDKAGKEINSQAK